MDVNFFNEKCKSSTILAKFGLCDDPPPTKKPAYLDTDDHEKWIAVVENNQQQRIDFYAIDHCVSLPPKDNGKERKRCDCLLYSENNVLIFVELKTRKVPGKVWVKDGIDQLISTIEVFWQNYDKKDFTEVKAFVCNRLKPEVNQGHAEKMERFKDQTGMRLYTHRRIVF